MMHHVIICGVTGGDDDEGERPFIQGGIDKLSVTIEVYSDKQSCA